MSGDQNSTQSLYSKAKLLVCSPSYSIGNLAGTVVSLAKDRRIVAGKSDPVGVPWAWAGGINFIAAQLGFVTQATSAAFIDKVVGPGSPFLSSSMVSFHVSPLV